MAKKQYIALAALQLKDADGNRQAIEPASATSSGLFEHEFSEADEKRLLRQIAIRFPEDLEQHADLAPQTELVDSRLIEGTATEVKKDAPATKKTKDEKPADDGLLT